MVFGGIQKLTLLDFPNKTACTIFTVGCDYDCPYCHNYSLIDTAEDIQVIEASEALGFLKTRHGLLDGVCISGGEPLLHDGLGLFIQEVKALGFLVKLDTNGSNPQKLKEMVETGLLDYVAMDVKNTPEKYAITIGVPGYDATPVFESAEYLLSNVVPYEFRTTVVREFHTVEDLLSIAGLISNADRYYLQAFANSDKTRQYTLSSYSDGEMEQLLSKVKTILPVAELRGI